MLDLFVGFSTGCGEIADFSENLAFSEDSNSQEADILPVVKKPRTSE